MINFSWINEHMAISGAIEDKDIPDLKRQGINAVIDLRSENSDREDLMTKAGVKFLHLAVNDRESPTPEQLKKIFDFIDPVLNDGEKILIHCQNGCGRSPLAAMAVLAHRGMDLPQAVKLVKQKHPGVGLTEQQEHFVDLELRNIFKNEKRL